MNVVRIPPSSHVCSVSRRKCSSSALQPSSLSPSLTLCTSALSRVFHLPPPQVSNGTLLLPPRNSIAQFRITFVVVCVAHTALAASHASPLLWHVVLHIAALQQQRCEIGSEMSRTSFTFLPLACYECARFLLCHIRCPIMQSVPNCAHYPINPFCSLHPTDYTHLFHNVRLSYLPQSEVNSKLLFSTSHLTVLNHLSPPRLFHDQQVVAHDFAFEHDDFARVQR